jgi:hypothetical protein
MFCPNCGKTVDKKLKYCNGCGERLSKVDEIDKDGTPGKMLDGILETLFWFAMVGLGILIGLVSVLLSKEVRTDLVALIVIAYLAVIFGVCFMLARQVPKLIDAKLRVWDKAAEPNEPARLAAPTTAQLGEPTQEPISVTEHTTRDLTHLPVTRK